MKIGQTVYWTVEVYSEYRDGGGCDTSHDIRSGKVIACDDGGNTAVLAECPRVFGGDQQILFVNTKRLRDKP